MVTVCFLFDESLAFLSDGLFDVDGLTFQVEEVLFLLLGSETV